jgi:hypothetical protein
MSDDPMSSALLHIEELESRCEHLETDRNNLALALETALRERDEARREVCVWQGLDTGSTPRDTATVRGWDCFKENTND